ncbi:hypothetical protein [Geothrix terrae]|uniref:hypothetical protein n=1 Tax=Geothrix terrae TaxID=2922720 RepID=UPI001FAB880A|nr:hypothetical protein [Geothrix terrae]
MTRALGLGLGLAFCLMLLGCGGGGGSSSPATPGAPQLNATYDPYKVEIKLTWTAAASNIDGYSLEYSYNSSAYAPINQTPIFGGVTSASLTFTSTPPELGVFDFRICSVWNGAKGPYSNVAEIKIPIAPPPFLDAVYSATDGGVHLNWASPSLLADHNVLERAPCDTSGHVSGSWSSLPLPSPLTSTFLDTTVVESQGYLYRVTAWMGTLPSPTTGPTLPVVIPPLPPVSFAAQALPGTVGLTWVNQSKTVTQIQIIRRVPGIPGTTVVLATLPGTATTYQDTGLALGYYGYSLSISDGRTTVTTQEILAAPANPPGSPTLTAATLAPSPYTSASALSPNGLWAFGTRTPFTALPADWGTWPAWSPASMFSAPAEFLQLDAQSRPHVLYQSQTSVADLLTHAWFDGSTWTTEVVQTMPTTSNVLATAFALDKTGAPQALQDTGPGGTLAGLVYSHKVAGAWIQEPLDPSAGTTTFLGTPTLFLDASDTPHALVASWSSAQAPIREYTRNANGTWTSQILPNPQTSGGFYHFQDGVWADAATAWVAYQSSDPSNPSNDGFWVQRKVAGAWQPPILLKSYLHTGTPIDGITLSPDGTRVAAVFNTTSGLYLNTWTATQGWVECLLPIPPDTQPLPYLKAAFDGANHLHILVKPSIFSGNLVDLHE